MNKVSRGDSSAAGSYLIYPLPCVCHFQCFNSAFVCVGSCQKVYPIITDSYHYHFLCLCAPHVIQLIKSASVNIQFQSVIMFDWTSGALLWFPLPEKNSTTEKLDWHHVSTDNEVSFTDIQPNTIYANDSSFPGSHRQTLPLPSQMPMRELETRHRSSDCTCRVVITLKLRAHGNLC